MAIVSENRTAKWMDNVGVEGGIPDSNNMSIYVTLPSSSSLEQINTAIANCPENQVVQLSAGTYNLSGQIIFNGRSGVVLRGDGLDTILVFTGGGEFGNILIKGPTFRSVVDNDAVLLADWIVGFSQNSHNIILNNVNSLSVGDIIVLDQLNDNNDVTVNNQEGCGYCSRQHGSRAQMQFTEVKAINENLVSIWPPIAMPNWKPSQSPQAWWLGKYAKKCGVENLKINGRSSNPYPYGSNISFVEAWNCWAKNIYSEAGNVCHINVYGGGRCEVRQSRFFDTQSAATQSYGILFSYASSNLIEDNIFEKITAPIVFGAGSSLNVISYNYMINMYYYAAYWMQAALAPHAAHTCMNLMEGNYVESSMYADSIHGSTAYNTIFRNRIVGHEEGKTANVYAMVFEALCRNYNVIGNILGKTGIHNLYEWNNSSPGIPIYRIGYNGTSASSIGYDINTLNTLYRHGNYDVVNNSVIWDSNNVDHNIPDSLYLSSKPSWFGDLVWPPFDPSNPSLAKPTSIPAGYRYINNTNPPQNTDTNIIVIAGVTKIITSNTVSLNGFVNLLTPAINWSVVSNPTDSTVTFSNISSSSTSVSFSKSGVYVLKLTATLEKLTKSDDIMVIYVVPPISVEISK